MLCMLRPCQAAELESERSEYNAWQDSCHAVHAEPSLGGFEHKVAKVIIL